MTINAKPVETHRAAPISVRIGNGHSELIHGQTRHCITSATLATDGFACADTARRRCLEDQAFEHAREAVKEAVIARRSKRSRTGRCALPWRHSKLAKFAIENVRFSRPSLANRSHSHQLFAGIPAWVGWPLTG